MDSGFLTQTKRQVQKELEHHLYTFDYTFWPNRKNIRRLVLTGPNPQEAVQGLEYHFNGTVVACDSDPECYSKVKAFAADNNTECPIVIPLDRPWNCLDPEDWTQALEVNETGFSSNPLNGFDLDFCKPLKDEDFVNEIAHLVYCTGTSPCWVRVTNSVGRVNTLEEHNFYTDMLIRLLTNNDLSQLLYLEKVSYLGGHSNKYPMRVLQLIIENKREVKE